MKSADSQGDTESALYIAMDIRAVLLARLYTSKFLISNSEKDLARVHKEFTNLSQSLIKTKNSLENKIRREKLQSAIELIKVYEDGVNEISLVITKRNEIINNKLNVKGPEIAKLAQEIKLSIKQDQDVIGPRVNKQNKSMKSITIVVGILLFIFIIFLSVYMIKNIFALMKPSSFLENISKGLVNGEADLTKRLAVKGSDEIATASNYINMFLKEIQSTISSVKQTSAENASISLELSTTSLSVGSNVENSVVVIEGVTQDAKSIQDEISSSILNSQESKKIFQMQIRI